MRAFLLPAALYALALVLGALFGYAPRIPWEDYQILDPQWLREDGLYAVFCLHSQPPLYNTLVWLALTLGDALHVSADVLLALIFWALGLAGTLALWDLTTRLLGRRGALILLALQLLSPAFYWYAFKLQYEFVLASLFMIFFALLHRHVEKPSGKLWAGMFGCIAGLVFTRTLFAPLWAVLMLAALTFYPPPRMRSVPARVGLFAACALLLCLWPLKNLAVYDQPTNTSWGGYNLQRTLPTAGDADFTRYLATGVAPAHYSQASTPDSDHICALPQNRAGHKPSGAINWHHTIFLAVDRPLSAQAVAYKRAHLLEVLRTSVFNYFAATRATYIHPYNNGPFNPPSALVALGHGLASHTLFVDLRGLLARALPAHALDRAQVEGHPLPCSLYGLVLPMFLLAALRLALRRTTPAPTRAVLLLGLFCVAWNIVIPSLTDGIEANRMRYATAWLALLLAGIVLRGVRLRRWTSSSSAPASAATR